MFFRHAIAVSLAMFLITLSVGVISIALLYRVDEATSYRITALEEDVRRLRYLRQ